MRPKRIPKDKTLELWGQYAESWERFKKGVPLDCVDVANVLQITAAMLKFPDVRTTLGAKANHK